MENQEPKSKSDHTCSSTEEGKDECSTKQTDELKVSIELLAQQYQAVVPIPYDELRTKFDEFWKEHSEVMVNRFNLKLKKKKNNKINLEEAQKILENTIKVDKLYKSIITNIFVNKIDETNNRKDCVLFINSVRLSNFEPDNTPFIVGMFYYRPNLELLDDIDFKLKRMPKKSWDDIWNNKSEYLKNKHKTFIPCEDDITIKDGMNVLMDIMASCDDKLDPDLSCRLNWFEVSNIKSESFKKELFKHKKNDLFDVVYIVKDDKGNDKEAYAHVKIHEVQTIVYPEINDELIQKESNKFKTLDEFMQDAKKNYSEYVDSIDKNVAVDHVMNQIATKSRIPPVPMGWIDSVANKRMEAHIANNQNNKDKAIKLIGASDEVGMFNMFCDYAHQDYVRDLVVRKYAEMYNLDFSNPESITNDIYNRIEWTEETK